MRNASSIASRMPANSVRMCVAYRPPNSASGSASAITSSVGAANALAYCSPELSPSAPSASASRSSARMASISSAVAARSSASIWLLRSVVWPTSVATFTAGRARAIASTYAPKVGYANASAPPSSASGTGSASPRSRAGDALIPQLPTMTVVTPCESLGHISGVRTTFVSSWVWTSMKPGARHSPVPSISCPADNAELGADAGDHSVRDRDVCNEWCGACAVDHTRVADECLTSRHRGRKGTDRVTACQLGVERAS